MKFIKSWLATWTFACLSLACDKHSTQAPNRNLTAEPHSTAELHSLAAATIETQAPAGDVAALANSTDNYNPGHARAAEALRALSACFANPTCDAKSRETLDKIQLMGFNLDTKTIKRPVPGCTSSASGLARSGFCGMMSTYDTDNVRAAISEAATCLSEVPSNTAKCIHEQQRAGTWLGPHSCSRDRPAELQDSSSTPPAGAFVQGQSWAVRISRVTTVAWTICLEGVDDLVVGVTMSATFAGE